MLKVILGKIILRKTKFNQFVTLFFQITLIALKLLLGETKHDNFKNQREEVDDCDDRHDTEAGYDREKVKLKVNSGEELGKFELRKVEEKVEVDINEERALEGLSAHKKLDILKIYKCSQCGKSFYELKLLSRHKNIDHMKFKKESNKPKQAKCEDCEKIFHSEHTLNDHIIIHHTKEYPHYCDNCGKGFTKREFKNRFENHRKRCIANGPKILIKKECDECKKSFKTLSAFKRHMMHHSKDRNYQCSDCGKSYADKRNLELHVIRTHPMNTKQFEREKNVPCIICDKKFLMKTELEHHKVEDHNQSYYRMCDLCGKGFIKETSKSQEEMSLLNCFNIKYIHLSHS